jgi:hypothetical protein
MIGVARSKKGVTEDDPWRKTPSGGGKTGAKGLAFGREADV